MRPEAKKNHETPGGLMVLSKHDLVELTRQLANPSQPLARILDMNWCGGCG